MTKNFISTTSNGLYCPAIDNEAKISYPATLFHHIKKGYYIGLRLPLRHDIQKKLFYSLQIGDIFSDNSGYLKVISRNTIEIWDALGKKCLGSVVYR